MKTDSESPVKQDEKQQISPETAPKTDAEGKVLGHQPLPDMQREYGGRKGPEATRFGDWELGGKCVDF